MLDILLMHHQSNSLKFYYKFQAHESYEMTTAMEESRLLTLPASMPASFNVRKVMARSIADVHDKGHDK